MIMVAGLLASITCLLFSIVFQLKGIREELMTIRQRGEAPRL